MQLRPQLPDHLEMIPDVDVDLVLADPDQPARGPDLAIVQPSARRRVRHEGGLIRACEVLVVEIVSLGSPD